MTQADILVKYSRRRLAEMILELQYQITQLEEQSFDYATRAMRAESALDLKNSYPDPDDVLTTNPPES